MTEETGTPTGTYDDPFHVIEQQYGVSGRPIFTHGPVVRRFQIAYLILAIACSLGLYLNYTATKNSTAAAKNITNERAARSVQINDYLTKQCTRDLAKDAVFIGILQDSIVRMQSSSAPPEFKSAYTVKTQRDISSIQRVDQLCFDQIPEPIPSH